MRSRDKGLERDRLRRRKKHATVRVSTQRHRPRPTEKYMDKKETQEYNDLLSVSPIVVRYVLFNEPVHALFAGARRRSLQSGTVGDEVPNNRGPGFVRVWAEKRILRSHDF